MISMIPGTQIADVFPTDTNAKLRGIKIMPLIIGDARLFFIRNRDITNTVVGIQLIYTQRVAAVNTIIGGEGYTHLFVGKISEIGLNNVRLICDKPPSC